MCLSLSLPDSGEVVLKSLPTVWTLEFSGHPPSRNDHVHWRTQHRWARQWKSATLVRVREAGIPPLGRVRLSLVIVRPRLGVADPDNDACRIKHLADGLVAAGVIKNDTYEFVDLGPVTEERGPKGCRLLVEAV